MLYENTKNYGTPALIALHKLDTKSISIGRQMIEQKRMTLDHLFSYLLKKEGRRKGE